MQLSPGDVDDFRERGLLVVRDLISKEQIQSLLRATADTKWIDLNIPWFDGRRDGHREITAVHFPHLVCDSIDRFSRSHEIVDLVSALCSAHLAKQGHTHPQLVQSMYYAKPPGALGQRWHQDERFTPTRDASLLTVWIALDKSYEENGCLFASPGSHTNLELFPHHILQSDGDVVQGEGLDQPLNIEPLTLEAGDVAVFSGYTVHGSHRNESNQSRRSLVLNYQRTSTAAIAGRYCQCGSPMDIGSTHAEASHSDTGALPTVVFAR